MSAKRVGAIRNTAQRSVGKLYKPLTSKSRQSLTSSRKVKKVSHQDYDQYSSNKKRTNSVGKIYNSTENRNRQFFNRDLIVQSKLNTLINYDERQHKLSDYLGSTMRSNNRLKYNYLSQFSAQTSQPIQNISTRRVSQINIKPNSNNFFSLAQFQQKKLVDSRVANFSKKLEKDIEVQRKNSVIKPQTKENESKKINKENEQKKQSKVQKNIVQQKVHREPLSSLFTANYQQNKSELSNKLMKIINNYETKNKQLTNKLNQLERNVEIKHVQEPKMQSKMLEIIKKDEIPLQKPKVNELIEEGQSYSDDFLTSIFNQLIDYNLKAICMSKQCDSKLDQLWKQIHKQIILDQKVRIIKLFINENNINILVNKINETRLKKVDSKILQTNSQQYDPFLVQKYVQMFQNTNPSLNHKKSVKWITDHFIKYYEEAEHHWLKYLSQQKMECSIKTMTLEKDISGLRHTQFANKSLNLRDFTRLLSTLFKANLRNRNVFHIFNKLRGMSYVGRFLQLLQQKAGKGQQVKKVTSK